MTLVVRDEADIVDEMLRYHLDHGVDFVVATDHRSVDGTTELLRSYERTGQLHLIREQGQGLRQVNWVTRMARLAATDFAADWVLNSDADEFWWPRGGTLKEVLSAVPPRFGTIRGLWRHFVPRPEPLGRFWERMVVRGRSTAVAAPYWPPQLKVAHRADPDVVVSEGNHDAYGRGLILVREWCPFEIFHFPIRTREQMERKFLTREAEIPDAMGGPHIEAMTEAIHARSAEGVFDELVVDEDTLATGLANGSLAVDTRLRDVLLSDRGAGAPVPPTPSLRDDVLFAEEFEALQSSDSAVRLARRVDLLERRLGAVEQSSAVASSRVLVKAGSVLRGARRAPTDIT